MNDFNVKIYNSVLQLSILVFTSALVYFAFVYYPRTINQYKTATLAQKPFVPSVVAQNDKFPIETTAYRLVFEASSSTYYVFVEGKTLQVFLENKNAADFALKNALSEDSLCAYNIIYSSVERLNVPVKYLSRPGC